jgi:hypothetical protein
MPVHILDNNLAAKVLRPNPDVGVLSTLDQLIENGSIPGNEQWTLPGFMERLGITFSVPETLARIEPPAGYESLRAHIRDRATPFSARLGGQPHTFGASTFRAVSLKRIEERRGNTPKRFKTYWDSMSKYAMQITSEWLSAYWATRTVMSDSYRGQIGASQYPELAARCLLHACRCGIPNVRVVLRLLTDGKLDASGLNLDADGEWMDEDAIWSLVFGMGSTSDPVVFVTEEKAFEKRLNAVVAGMVAFKFNRLDLWPLWGRPFIPGTLLFINSKEPEKAEQIAVGPQLAQYEAQISGAS